MSIETFIGTLILSCIGAYFVWRNNFKVRQAGAASVFRAAIDPSFIGDLRGHSLVQALFGVQPGTGHRIEGIYFKHRRAVHDFRRYLNPIDSFRLNKAWKKYHGGNEDYPDFLVLYGIPENGHEILKHNLEALQKIANQT